jgi:hypothetical protein
MTGKQLRRENRRFRGTAGVSERNRSRGFVPAFCDMESGRTEQCRFTNGAPAPLHLLQGVPPEWIAKKSPLGTVLAIKATVVAGFLREGRFYTRDEAASRVTEGRGARWVRSSRNRAHLRSIEVMVRTSFSRQEQRWPRR